MVKNVIFWIATILVVVAIILVALPMLGNLQYKTIVSGSMEPEIPVGSLIFISPIQDEKIRIGDTITFATTDDVTVTHKVVGYELSKNALITHGVANDDGNNEITPYSKVIGKVIFSIPFIGRVFLIISTMRGKIIAATAITVLYIISVIFETVGSPDDGKEEKEDEPDSEQGRRKLKQLPGKEKDGEEADKPKQLGRWLEDIAVKEEET